MSKGLSWVVESYQKKKKKNHLATLVHFQNLKRKTVKNQNKQRKKS